MPWKPNYKWSGDTETCATCPSLSLWFHLLPHVFGSLHFSAVDLLAISQTSQVHFRAFAFAAPSTFNVVSPNSHTATSLTSYTSLLKRHQRDFPWAYLITQIHTAALTVTLLLFSVALTIMWYLKGQPLCSSGQFLLGMKVDICVQIFSSFKRSWKFWFLSTISCKWVSEHCEGQTICLV